MSVLPLGFSQILDVSAAIWIDPNPDVSAATGFTRILDVSAAIWIYPNPGCQCRHLDLPESWMSVLPSKFT